MGLFSLFSFITAAILLGCVLGDHYHPSAPGSRTSSAKREEMDPKFWNDKAQAGIQARLSQLQAANRARNVVMFLGDGMSMPTISAARALLGQRRGDTGEEAELTFDTFPTVGLIKTYCVDAQVADSACSATAYLCGVKTNYGVLGVNAAVPRTDCEASVDKSTHLQSIVDWALADGRDTGIVTTTRITHASPAGAYAKTADRYWESDADVKKAGFDTDRCPDIAHQLIHNHPGNKLKVIFGGGRANFLPNSIRDDEQTFGSRTDNRNLIQEWQQDKVDRNIKHEYIWHREQLMRAKNDLPEYMLGLFESGHMQYNMLANQTTEPTLAEMTEVAIRSLSRNEKGFFLFVEGGRIDHAHHDNFVELALDETLEMDKAVKRAAELLSEEDSLIVVTADHSHVLAYNGYAPRGNDILGTSVFYANYTWDGMPYMTLSYTNGPGFRHHVNDGRPNVTDEENYGTVNWHSPVDVPLSYETHGGDEVVVFARGPHHSMFTGLYEQSQLPHLMAYAACIGPGRHACSAATHALAQPVLLLTLFILLASFGVK
ncbi:membrane-bound alkaline phosphatase-like [Spodoptera litura]|uniref:Alkaline phosphatase n=1 Tax=Spodoptera litura TaxID=69820 RepID=R4I4E9_SPOLT|nr:membrane-bound alkaline phosphatase-like [Spodoptera litura]AFJ04289.1 alkaline phosphatase 1 [Spodoptera litura]